jgi:hypothetical protein
VHLARRFKRKSCHADPLKNKLSAVTLRYQKFFFRIRTVLLLHRDIIKAIYSPTDAQVIVLKTALIPI